MAMRGDNQSIVHGLTAAGEQFPEGHAMPLRLGQDNLQGATLAEGGGDRKAIIEVNEIDLAGRRDVAPVQQPVKFHSIEPN